MNYRSLTYQRIRLKQRAVLSAHGRRFREGCLLRCALPESIQSNRQISSFPDIFLGTTPVLPFPQLMRHPPPDMDLDMILSIRESRQGLGGSLISYHGTKFRLLDAYGHVVGFRYAHGRVNQRTLQGKMLQPSRVQLHTGDRRLSLGCSPRT